MAKEEKKKQIESKQFAEKQRIDRLEREYGTIGGSFETYGFHLIVFHKTKKILFYRYKEQDKTIYSFKEFIDYSFDSKNETTETTIRGSSSTTFTTQTSGKSMLGRALAGAVIAGPIGAVIGGATAKKTTIGTTVNTPERIERNVRTTYCVVIKTMKDGVQDTIPYYTSSKNNALKLKTVIESIILYPKS